MAGSDYFGWALRLKADGTRQHHSILHEGTGNFLVWSEILALISAPEEAVRAIF